MRPVDRYVILVAERRNGQIDRWQRAVLARLGPGVFDRPASIAILLRQFRRLVLPAVGNTPVLDRFFSAIVLRCFGAATIVASTIWPDRARKPEARKAASKRRNSPSIAAASFSASRNVQIVLASGTASARLSPRNRMNDSRSLIRYSARSSESECIACRINILNINT